MSQYGQMLAAAQAFATPEQQRKLAQTQSQASEYAVGKEKKSQQEELEALMEAEMKKASEKKGKFGFLGALGKLAGFFMPGVGAGLQALSSAGQASAQKKALKKLMKDPKFAKYEGSWLGDPTKQYLKDVKGLAGDIDPLKTGLTSFATSMASGKMMKGIGDKVGGMFKGTPLVDDLGYSIDPTFGDTAATFAGGAGGPMKNLMANIKDIGIGEGGLKDLFKDFDLMDIMGEGLQGQENLQALPLFLQMFGAGGGGNVESDASSYFR